MAYRLKYSDYSTTASGPPDPAAWIGPPGPQGVPGPQGSQGAQGATGPQGASGVVGSMPEAPTDGAIYGRQGSTGTWLHATEAANVLNFGARCDGTTDDTSAVNSALASGARIVTIPPNATCYLPNGITVPGGVHLKGLIFQANNMSAGTAPSSTILTGPNINSVTLMDDGDGARHGSSLSDLVITTNSVSKPTAGAAVYVHAGYNVRLARVMVWNAYDGFYFLSTPSAGGIAGWMDNCGSGRIAGHHVVQNAWPELRLSSCRIGSNAGGDFGALAYCYVTGGNPGNSILPNGLFCTNCQFNEFTAVGALLLIGGLTNSAKAQEFHFINCHAEAVSNFVATDATVTELDYLLMTGNHFVYQSGNFFALNAATNVINSMVLSGNFINTSTFTISSALFNDCVISGNSIGVSNTTIGSTSNSSLAFAGNAVVGNLTFSGGWAHLWAGGGSLRGTLTNTATGFVRIDTPRTSVLGWLPASTSYASDAAAAAGGVAVGQLYRNGSVVQVRVA